MSRVFLVLEHKSEGDRICEICRGGRMQIFYLFANLLET